MTEAELIIQAEIEIPMPVNACPFIKMRINWRRECWVRDYLLNNPD